jgi:hypothetical protein
MIVQLNVLLLWSFTFLLFAILGVALFAGTSMQILKTEPDAPNPQP